MEGALQPCPPMHMFTLFGLLICIVGVAYMSEIVGAVKTAAVICTAAGPDPGQATGS